MEVPGNSRGMPKVLALESQTQNKSPNAAKNIAASNRTTRTSNGEETHLPNAAANPSKRR
jgi:hypothetical protein